MKVSQEHEGKVFVLIATNKYGTQNFTVTIAVEQPAIPKQNAADSGSLKNFLQRVVRIF